jgi:hypothetical protein
MAVSALAGSEYYAFCDADDLWCDYRLDVVRFVLSRTSADVLFHPAFAVGRPSSILEGDMLMRKNLPRRDTFLADLLVAGNFLTTSTVVLRASQSHVPLFADGLSATQDMEAWCRFASFVPHPRVAYLDMPLASYRWMGGLSLDAWRRARNVYQNMRAYSSGVGRRDRYAAKLRGIVRLGYYAARHGVLVDFPRAIVEPVNKTLFRGPEIPTQ